MNDNRLVGLCIVFKNYNYGSILQSYATLLKLESLGLDYEIIRYNPKKNLNFYIKSLPRIANMDMVYSKVRKLKRKLGRKRHPDFAKNDNIRGIKFQEFIDNHFSPFSKPIHSYTELQSYVKKYTDVMVGSDQLWLPSGLATNYYNLLFVPEYINKIAYSASFGVSKIPTYQRKRTKEYLERINYLSVREQSGANIIKNLTGRNAQVILDPTMIINRSIWDMNIKEKRIVDGDYIFCYFLGNNPDQREEVKKLAKKKNLPVIVLRHLDEYIPSDERFGDQALYDVGPEEFVNLIRNASFICTDSFHGSVFSIIYHKRFISFDRYRNTTNSRNSRLDTLFANIGIDRRFHGNILEEIDSYINYNDVDKKIELLRKKSEKFILEAFSVQE